MADAPGTAYNPLYLTGPEGAGKSTILAALGRSLQETGDRIVGYIDGHTFSEELIGALERNRVEAWRARYRRADVLLLDDVDSLEGAERAHHELFTLFEALHRAGRQLVFAAAVPPAELPLPDRLRSRLEAGLVVDLAPRPGTEAAADERPLGLSPEPAVGREGTDADTAAVGPTPSGGTQARVPPAGRQAGQEPAWAHDPEPGRSGHWIESREKVLWEWPYAEDWIEESPD